MNPTPSDDRGGEAVGAGHAPWLELARTGDWRGLVALGRFGLAAQTLRLTGASDQPDVLEALDALTEVEASVRAKAPRRATVRLARLDVRPASLLDWEALGADLHALIDAAGALDRQEADAARAALERLQGAWFAAERDAQRGTIALLEGDPGTARAHLEAALERDPNHVRALTNLGNLKLEGGEVDAAIADYERAIKLDDTFANAHHNLGVAYRRKGQVAKSVATLRRAQRVGAKRDAEEARAAFKGVRSGAGGARWVRPVLIGAAVVALVWWWGQRGGP
ncbi:MAG: tetratricopeptide repeat protein [Trueperaceae bacterium]|nr:tetratricopeptide repeat protein [Trueperaceae bacterium]